MRIFVTLLSSAFFVSFVVAVPWSSEFWIMFLRGGLLALAFSVGEAVYMDVMFWWRPKLNEGNRECPDSPGGLHCTCYHNAQHAKDKVCCNCNAHHEDYYAGVE